MKKSLKKQWSEVNKRIRYMQEKARDATTYRAHALCRNCGYKGRIYIQKGKPIEEVLKEKVCPNCRCKSLNKIWKFGGLNGKRNDQGASLGQGEQDAQDIQKVE